MGNGEWGMGRRAQPLRLWCPDHHQPLPLLHRLPNRDVDLFDHSGPGGLELVLHLHRFQNQRTLARDDLPPWLHQDPYYQPRHRGLEHTAGTVLLACSYQATDVVGPLIQRLDLVPLATILHQPLA